MTGQYGFRRIVCAPYIGYLSGVKASLGLDCAKSVRTVAVLQPNSTAYGL